MTVINADTTVQGNTHTVKSTTRVTATVTATSGSGPCHLERLHKLFDDYAFVIAAMCITWVMSLASLLYNRDNVEMERMIREQADVILEK